MTMPDPVLPRYPVYIPSKGRSATAYTAQCLTAGDVPFFLVIEPQELAEYAKVFGRDRCLVLPFHDQGSSVPARNWIKDHSIAAGYERHWQLDDNMRYFFRRYRGKRLYCDPGLALRVCEDFTDRYVNIAIAGLNYSAFVPDHRKRIPVQVNCHVYSCTLINNAIPFRWRGRYNEDTDICLQALAGGWCTVLLNTFVVQKIQTMKVKGGNTETLYQGDGRLRMARSLERMWPGVVSTRRRFQRPQHVVKDDWRYFDTPLKLKPGIDLAALPPIEEYGMQLSQVSETIHSARLKRLYEKWQQQH